MERLNLNHQQDPDLESPKSSNRELRVEVSNEWKIANIAQVDKVVLAVKFAKGGEGLQVCLGINDERFYHLVVVGDVVVDPHSPARINLGCRFSKWLATE